MSGGYRVEGHWVRTEVTGGAGRQTGAVGGSLPPLQALGRTCTYLNHTNTVGVEMMIVPLDAPGQRRGQLRSSGSTRHRAVKQGKYGGSVGTTSQGKGRGSREVRIGQAGGGRAQGGERPMGTAAYGGKGFKGTAAGGQKPPPAADSNTTRCHAEPSFKPKPR